jgi:hypothetical protein
MLVLATFLAFQAYAFQDRKKPADIDLKTIDAIEAMAIANQWKWSQKDVKSSVTARAVMFQFADAVGAAGSLLDGALIEGQDLVVILEKEKGN